MIAAGRAPNAETTLRRAASAGWRACSGVLVTAWVAVRRLCSRVRRRDGEGVGKELRGRSDSVGASRGFFHLHSVLWRRFSRFLARWQGGWRGVCYYGVAGDGGRGNTRSPVASPSRCAYKRDVGLISSLVRLALSRRDHGGTRVRRQGAHVR